MGFPFEHIQGRRRVYIIVPPRYPTCLSLVRCAKIRHCGALTGGISQAESARVDTRIADLSHAPSMFCQYNKPIFEGQIRP